MTRHGSPRPAHAADGVRHLHARAPAPDPPAQPPLLIAVEEDGGRLLVQISGELDLATTPRLATCLQELTGAGDSIGLDLARVTFVDLSGLRVLLEARRDARSRGKRLHVAAPGDACRRLIELTRTLYLLDPA